MNNVFNRLLNSWYLLLSGNINVPVYRIDAPDEATDYVLLRPESETGKPNNAAFITHPVIIVEIVTRFNSGELINDTAAHDIDNLISSLVLPTPQTIGLASQGGIQIVSVEKRDSTYFPEDDGTYRYYRILNRYHHTVNQII